MRRGQSWGFFTALTLVAVVLLVIFLVRDFAGTKNSDAPFASVEQAVMAQVDTAEMQEADDRMAKRLYGLDPSSYEGFVLYYPNTNMGADELLLIKLAGDAQREEAAAAIAARLEAQKKNFDGYGAEQTALLEASAVEVQGNYLLFCAADNADDVRRAFLQAL